jgi:hypothetical protein
MEQRWRNLSHCKNVVVNTDQSAAATSGVYNFNSWILEDKVILPGLPGNAGPVGYPPLLG